MQRCSLRQPTDLSNANIAACPSTYARDATAETSTASSALSGVRPNALSVHGASIESRTMENQCVLQVKSGVACEGKLRFSKVPWVIGVHPQATIKVTNPPRGPSVQRVETLPVKIRSFLFLRWSLSGPYRPRKGSLSARVVAILALPSKFRARGVGAFRAAPVHAPHRVPHPMEEELRDLF